MHFLTAFLILITTWFAIDLASETPLFAPYNHVRLRLSSVDPRTRTMSAAFLNAVKTRRTYYALSAASPIPASRIVEIVNESILHAPSTFNSQSARAVVLIGEEHRKVWNITKDAIRAVVSAEQWPESEKRLNGFFGAYGTVLFFDERKTVQGLQNNMPAYADKFPQFADMANGLLEYIVWTALELEGLGANLQHYNPLIDEKVASTWGLSPTWELKAQLVFGKIESPPSEKTFLPLEERVKTFIPKEDQ